MLGNTCLRGTRAVEYRLPQTLIAKRGVMYCDMEWAR